MSILFPTRIKVIDHEFSDRAGYRAWLIDGGFREKLPDPRAHSHSSSPFVWMSENPTESPDESDFVSFVGGHDDTIGFCRGLLQPSPSNKQEDVEMLQDGHAEGHPYEYDLVVIGGGKELEYLKAIAKPNIQILGRQPDDIVEKYMSEAKAYVYAGCEDFGIVMVEAQACGTPVIAFGRGGAAEIVRDVRTEHPGTGILFPEQSINALVEAINLFETYQSDITPKACLEQAQRFTSDIFWQSYVEFVNNCQKGN